MVLGENLTVPGGLEIEMKCGYCKNLAVFWIEWDKGNWSPGTKSAPVCDNHTSHIANSRITKIIGV